MMNFDRVVLICGDRHWKNYDSILSVVKRLVAKYGNVKIVEGGCTGADEMAKKAAIECGLEYVEYPADWNKFGKAAGPIRNQQMLDDEHPNIVIAFHTNIKNSKGTKDMVLKARKAGIETYIFRRLI
jgi:hypothetical protein